MRIKVIIFVLLAGTMTISSLVLQNTALKRGLEATIANYYQNNR